ncbi:MAG: hypothetical protein Q8P41_24405 [Pseudomonadota bacterium]|nr:hypothetical protein [Pseudomonadota bacterium]
MKHLLFTALLGIVGCDGTDSAGAVPPPALAGAGPMAPCASYVDLPDVFGYCIAQHVGALPNPAAMVSVCQRLGVWQGPCRQAWVLAQRRSGRISDPDLLLAACGPFADCAFEQLDTAPIGGVLAQIDRCETYARPYFADCAGHALTRWVHADPTLAEAEALRLRFTDQPEVLGRFLALAAACSDVGIRCGDGPDRVSYACRTAEAELAGRPQKCRVR